MVEHAIDTGNHAPIRQRQYRIPATVTGEVDKQVEDMLRNGIIEHSQSPWASPMMIVKQNTRDGKVKFRFVIDMRKLNEVTVKDAYPLPRIDQTLDALGGSSYLSVIDAARGYYQVPLKEKDREKTAFVANNRLYQFRVMSLGLSNAPSTYSRLMDLVLSGLTYKYCLVYLDDTIIYSKSFEEHLEHLDEVFNRFINAKLKLKPEKCTFAADKVSYLGFIVTTKGIRPDASKVEVIKDMPFPKSAKEMVRFLGAVNFYRDFIPHFSDIASILYKMSQSEKKFKSRKNSTKAHESFEKLKTALVSSPLLAFPDFKLPFTIPCDASNVALGAVIGQLVNQKFHPVMYGSRHLTAAESRYSTTERELLAIVWAAKRFNAYIYGRHVTFITDHQPLVTMRSLKEPMGRIGRLFYKIQDLDYDLIYQPGSSNYTADMLSRPGVAVNSIELRVESCVNWSLEQSLDPKIRALKLFLEGKLLETAPGSLESSVELPQDVQVEWGRFVSHLCLQNDIVLLMDGEHTKIVVPQQLIPVLLKVHHDLSLAGHRDFEKTYDGITAKYFWIKMHLDVKAYCSSCHLCQTKKYINQSFRAPMKPIIVNQPWELIGIDGTGPLPITPDNNRYILVVVDHFSKFCIAKAVPDLTAISTAKFVFDDVICKFGMPRSLISDHGKNFKSVLFAQLCNLCQIKTCNSTFYHPEGNGLVERMNKTLKQILTMYVNASHSNWDVHLQAAVSAYNTSLHKSIGCSPYEVVFGRKAINLADVILSRPVNVVEKPVVQYLVDLKQRVKVIHENVDFKKCAAQACQKEYYDRFIKASVCFKPGDLVRLVNERSVVGQSKSFKERAVGPFKVVKQFNDVNYTIISLDTNKVQNVHYNRLRPYHARARVVQQQHPFDFCCTKPPSGLAEQTTVIDMFMVSQFLQAIRSNTDPTGAPVVQVVAVEAVGNVGTEVTASDSEVMQVNDDKQACPVCKKLFARVNIHISKAKDERHIRFRQDRIREEEELVRSNDT